MKTRSINLMLALIMAMWTPVWCCCATQASPANAAQSDSLASADTCPKCVANETKTPTDSNHPHGSHSSDCPTCPHGTLHSWAKLDKSPELKSISTPPCFLFTLDQITVLHVTCDTAHLPLTQDSPPDLALVSLISLHCMLTI